MSNRHSNTLFATGVIGSIIAALCCFTPVLSIPLAAIGLGGRVGYLNFVLLPALVIFTAMTIYAVVKRREGCGEERDVAKKARHRFGKKRNEKVEP